MKKKLTLKKLTVSNLDVEDKKQIKGGFTTSHDFWCETKPYATCNGYTCDCTTPHATCYSIPVTAC